MWHTDAELAEMSIAERNAHLDGWAQDEAEHAAEYGRW